MKKLLLCLALARFAFAQTATFPSAIATDDELGIAANNVSTSLRSGVTASDTIWVVSDASRIRPYMKLGCEKEAVSVVSVSGNQITVVRGFDGTTATSHSSSRVVEVRPIAWDKNIIAAHIKAIEASLGAGLGNVASLPAGSVISSRYDFPAQTPGGSLVIGNNAVTLTPVPFGVNGTNTNHRLYVSGGTGTAESCLITGGGAVSGASSGQVIINCANAHSGSWTIKSATAGIKEAIYAGGSRVQVTIPAGDINVYSAVVADGNEVTVTGQGQATHIVPQYTTGDVFYFNGAGIGSGTGYRNSIRDLYISPASSGNSVIGVHLNGQVDFRGENVFINNVDRGFYIEGTTTTSGVRIHHCNISGLTPTSGVGIYQNGGADIFADNNVILGFYATQPFAGIRVDYSTGTKLLHNEVFATGFGVYIAPGNGQQVIGLETTNNWYDSGSEDGMAIVPSGTGTVKHVRSVNDWFSIFTRNGIEIGSVGTIDNVAFVSPLVRRNTQNGIVYSGGNNVSFIGAMVTGNSWASPGTYHGFQANANAGGFRIVGGVYGPAGETSTQGYGILINAGTGNNFSISGAVVSGNLTGGIADGTTGTSKMFSDNLGTSNGSISVSSASSINLGVEPIEMAFITGNTAVQTITPAWNGRRLRLLFTGSSPSIQSGGNIIGSSRVLAQYDSLDCQYIPSTGWSCVGP